MQTTTIIARDGTVSKLYSYRSLADILDVSPKTLVKHLSKRTLPKPTATRWGPRFTHEQVKAIIHASIADVAQVKPTPRRFGRPCIIAKSPANQCNGGE